MGTNIAFISVKGGVGKTTLALEMASALANDFGKKVLLVDANFSAPNIGLYLDLKKDLTLHNVLNGDEGLHATICESFGFDVVPASMEFSNEIDPFKLKKILEKYKHRYDFIILDSSPNYKEMLPVVVAADKIFVVTTPDRVTMHTSLKAAKIARDGKTPVTGVIINRIQNSKYEIDLKEIESTFDLPVLARIRDNQKILEAGHFKIPITVYDSLNIISREIKRLASAVVGEKEKVSLFNRIFKKSFMGKERVNRELMRQSFYDTQFG